MRLHGILDPTQLHFFLLLDHFFKCIFPSIISVVQTMPKAFENGIETFLTIPQVQERRMQAMQCYKRGAKILMECQKMASKIAVHSRVFLP